MSSHCHRTWSNGKLQDLVFFQRGFDITKAEQKEGDIPVISSSGVTSYHSEAKVSGPGIIIGRKGSLGTVHYSEGPYWPHDTTLWSKDIKGNNPRYIYYFLKTLGLERFDVGNSNPTLNRNHIHDMVIKIPSKDIQQKIVEILTPYDDLIENNRRRIQLLEEAARLLYQEWFVRLRFPGHEHTKIVDGVPEGWITTKIGDIGDIITGKTPSTKKHENYGDDIPFIKTPDMHDYPIIIKTEQKLSEIGANSQSNKYIPPGSLLISCIGTVGVVSINSSISQTNQQINSIIPSHDYYRYYLYFLLTSLKSMLEGMGGGSTMANINKSKFSMIQIVIPSNKILMEYHNIVHPLFCQIQNLMNMSYRAMEGRDLLLPRLMNGVIPV